MEKTQMKVRKDKKKNIQTGILMGQNTNAFSQLSATYLQNKTDITEEEEQFLKSTTIIQYHDPNINRILGLLRKKADVTKGKAAIQLREQIEKMDDQSLEQFMPIFSHLFLQIIINQQTKQVIDQLTVALTNILLNKKKLVLKQITTFYGPILLNSRINPQFKAFNLLFNGTEKQINQKALILLLKKDVKKKFLTMTKIILQTDEMHKIAQQNYQRNCVGLMKLVRDFIKIWQANDKKNDEFRLFLEQIDNLLQGKCIDQYLQLGNKSKAALLQTFSKMLQIYSQNQDIKINWKYYAEQIASGFLDKDMIVQQSLWKVNRAFIQSLVRIAKNENLQNPYEFFYKNLPKPEEKLLAVLKIGGLFMYKNLRNYLEVHPQTSFNPEDPHKAIVNKIGLIRKIFQSLLEQEDQNEARTECYYDLAVYFLPVLKKLVNNESEDKKAKQINTLSTKCQKQIIENLQNKYYSTPPSSKISPTYYFPQIFSKLISEANYEFQFKFDQNSTIPLYSPLKNNQADINKRQAIFQKIFNNCKDSPKLTLNYLLNFPKRHLEVDLTSSNPNHQQAAKIFLLSKQAQEKQWFNQNWDIISKMIVYDPRLTQKQLTEVIPTEQFIDLYYKPVTRLDMKMFDCSTHDDKRINFFISCLTNEDYCHGLKYLIPYMNDFLIKRNRAKILTQLLQIFQKSSQQLNKNTWAVSLHEITKIRVICDIIFEMLKQESELKIQKNQLLDIFFINFCQFARRMFNYRMQKQAFSLLQQAHELISQTQQYSQNLFKSVEKCLQLALKNVHQVFTKQQKVRKVRIGKLVDFFDKVFWYLLPRNNSEKSQILALNLFCQSAWQQADNRIDMWMIGRCILNSMNDNSIEILAKMLVNDISKYEYPICLILCCQEVLPLQLHSEAKKLFSKLQEQIIRQIKSLQSANSLKIARILFQFGIKSQKSIVSMGVKTLIKSLLKNYQEIQKQVLNQYVDSFLMFVLKMILETNQQYKQDYLARIFSIAQNVIVQLPLSDIPNTQKAYEELKQKLNIAQGGQFIVLCGLISIIWESGFGLQYIGGQNKTIFEGLLVKLFKTISCNQQSSHSNFNKAVLFSFINSAFSTVGIASLKDLQESIIVVFQDKVTKQHFLHGVTQANRIRFASRVFADMGDTFIRFVVNQLPNQCLEQYNYYKTILNNLEQEEEQNNEENAKPSRHQHIINTFIQYSELFVRMVMILDNKNVPSQSVLLQLLQCPFAGLKRTVFIVLKQIYELKLVTNQPPALFKNILKPKFNYEAITPVNASKMLSYYYAWQMLIFRRPSIENTRQQQDNVVLTLQDYLSSDNYHQQFLKTTFQVMETGLEYLKKQMNYDDLTPQQLSNDDIVNISLDQDPRLPNKVFKLVAKSLFLFTLNFPLFLRHFIDKFKKYKNICDRLLRNLVADAIFKEEVKRVQMKEHEWKTDGNFEIYVNAKNRQIYAEYTHDVIRIGLRLTMKATYPLMPIVIEFGEGLKIEDGNRWQLMLQSQLHNRNNTIINGILLWKTNIDKKLSGVEQCAICFDIVNGQGQLPKKGCKTCRKKFHGNCVMKWFSKSNKSQCPLCKSQFL